jgi:predicted nucleic acid-binding protein
VNACFGDTSYYLALLVPQDANHDAARQLALDLQRRVVTSEFVLLEVGNFLSATRSRLKFAGFLGTIRADS